MSKFKNTKFKASFPEYIGLLIFAGLLVASLFFLKNTLEIENLSNIGKTNVDFIIQAPSKDQVSEIADLNHIERIVPYYFKTIDYSSQNGKITTSLFIVDKSEDVEYTTFSKSLKIKGTELAEQGVLITEDFAKAAGLKAGSEITLNIDGTSIPFVVSAIYKSDYRRVGGSVLALNTGNVTNALKSRKYNGAFIASNDLAATASYLKGYRPEGDLRSEDEFETKEAYQTYLETRNQSDTTTEAFSTADYINELRKRNSERLIRGFVFSLTCIIVAHIIIAVLMAIRTGKYTKVNVKKDIKDNFTYKQESEMYFRYYFFIGIFLICFDNCATLGTFLLGMNSIILPYAAFNLLLTAIVICIVGLFETLKMKKRHFVVKN